MNNSKTKDPKVFKLVIEMTLGYPTSGIVLRLKGQRLGLRLGLGLTAIPRDE